MIYYLIANSKPTRYTSKWKPKASYVTQYVTYITILHWICLFVDPSSSQTLNLYHITVFSFSSDTLSPAHNYIPVGNSNLNYVSQVVFVSIKM